MNLFLAGLVTFLITLVGFFCFVLPGIFHRWIGISAAGYGQNRKAFHWQNARLELSASAILAKLWCDAPGPLE